MKHKDFIKMVTSKKCHKLEETNSKLSRSEQWTQSNQQQKIALNVLEFGLDLTQPNKVSL
jgi:hypothetical protein